MHNSGNTTELFLIAMLIILTLPWRGRGSFSDLMPLLQTRALIMIIFANITRKPAALVVPDGSNTPAGSRTARFVSSN